MKTLRFSHKLLLPALSAVLLFSCGDSEKEKDQTADSIAANEADSSAGKTLTPRNYSEFNIEKAGPVGVYDVPEMLTLCYRDSASAERMAEAFANAYTILQKELKELNLTPNGAPGSLYYNNDPRNFIFECVYPISRIPSKNPKQSKVVVLEAASMYIYNYYGPYGDLFKAYDEIRSKLKAQNLEQAGPMREFYMTASSNEPDSTKWLTRIMVPVIPKRK